MDGIRSGAAKGATAVQPNDNITVLNNNAGYITGISASMVITALGYTPVNPSNLATVATSGSYNDLSDKPTIPTTLAGLTGDVSISSPTNGQSLQYDAALNKWKNVSSTASIGFDGITGSPEDNVALKNALDLKADVATTYTKTEVDTALSGKANTDLDNLTTTGKANVSKQGTYNSGETYSVGTVGNAIQNKANVALDNITSAGKAVCANMAMPSGTYDSLTLGASGSTYTAPADGYFVLTKSTSADGQYIQLGSGVWSGPSSFSWSGSQYNACHAFVPARKGQVITVDYTAGGSATFRFYYANGAS